MSSPEKILSFGTFRWAPSRQQLLEGDRPVRVGSRALGLLDLLLARAGEVVTKQQLMDAVWSGALVDEANLRANIGMLRKALGDGRDGRRYIVNVPGRGYRFVEPVDGRDPPRRNDQDHAVEATRSAGPKLIGRTMILRDIAAGLAQHRLLTITGAGGIGKTSLALAAAEAWSQVSDDATVLIDLTPVKDFDQIWAAAARALGVEPAPNLQVQIERAMTSRRRLVVLDNCEHVIAAAAQFSRAILDLSAAVRVLATSREPLRVEGEWVHRLAPLDVPAPGTSVAARDAIAYSAVELLAERVAAVRGGYELNDDDAPFAADICRSLDGNPLAIELAAAQAEAFGMRQLAEGLRDRFGFLSKGRRGAATRHQSLYAMLDWSYQLLSPHEQALLGCLSVFPTWFVMSDAAALGTALAMPATAVAGCLGNLVTTSIVVASIRPEGGRYRLQESVRAFARLKLEQGGRTAEMFRVFVAYVTQALSVGPNGSEAARSAWQACCTRHIENTRACLDWSVGDGHDPTAGVDLVAEALPFWTIANQLVEHRTYLEAALTHLRALRPRRRPDELAIEIAIGLSQYFAAGPVPDVIDQFKHALNLARRLGSKSQVLNILWMLYGAAGNWGDYPAQLRFAKQFSAASARVRDRHIQARRHRMLARAHHDCGNQKVAVREIERALIAPQPFSPAKLDSYSIDDGAAALAVRSRILWVTGAVDDATAVADECLDRCLTADHASLVCWAISLYLCPIAIWTGDITKARRLALLAGAHSEKALVHWNEWVRIYHVLLHEPVVSAPAELLRRMMPAQRGLFATLSPLFLGNDIIQRATRPTCWYSPELIRIGIESRPAKRADSSDVRRLREADQLASRQDALSWRLRIGASMARRYLAQDQTSKARAALEPVYERFRQGFQTQDLRVAEELLAAM